MTTYYKAPWGRALVIISSIASFLCVGVSLFAIYATREAVQHTAGGSFWIGARSWAGFLPMVIVLICAPFMIRGYSVTADAILIHRLFWATRLPRAGLQAARFEPRAMRWSLRCGNGGLFSISGFYWNRRLGVYRAFVTDLRRTVILRFAQRTVVLSPAVPERFVQDILQPA